MKRPTTAPVRRLLIVAAAVLSVACTPSGPGATTGPANASAPPSGGSVAPPSMAPSLDGKGGYGY